VDRLLLSPLAKHRPVSRCPATPALHVYGHPPAPGYLSTQESFARERSWFAVQRLAAVSHFPTLEAPDETARVISAFID